MVCPYAYANNDTWRIPMSWGLIRIPSSYDKLAPGSAAWVSSLSQSKILLFCEAAASHIHYSPFLQHFALLLL